MSKNVRIYQSDQVLTRDEKELAYRLANLWQSQVYVYIEGERSVVFSQEKEGRREPADLVLPSEKGKARKLEDEPMLYKGLEAKSTPQPVAVADGSDLV